MDEKKRTVMHLRMPLCSNGFRSGYATAVVDGVPKQLYTSRHETTDYFEHETAVREMFEAGKGHPG